MIKFIILVIMLIALIPLTSESLSYFDADMIHYDIENTNNNNEQSKPSIIKFNEPFDEQVVKRYLVFGKGSLSELGNLGQNMNSISSPNGFFSIVTATENTISIFQY